MRSKIIIFVTLILLTGCSNIKNSAMISWVDFIKLNDITYINLNEGQKIWQENELDKEYGKVQNMLNNNVTDPEYKSKNGDSAYLEKDTKIYQLKDYNPKFRLAVILNNKIVMYEADTNPTAKKGEDLLDIRGRVNYIGINSEEDSNTELASIKDSKKVSKLEEMILSAPVNQDYRNSDGTRYFISLHLKDGSIVNRSFWLKSGELSRGIMLPKEFVKAVEEALDRNSKKN